MERLLMLAVFIFVIEFEWPDFGIDSRPLLSSIHLEDENEFLTDSKPMMAMLPNIAEIKINNMVVDLLLR